MKVGDKVKFVKHYSGCEHLNTQSGLVIGNIYTVEDIDRDGFLRINYGQCTYLDEVQLVEINEYDKQDEHYNNENGSLYLFAQHHNLNAWEFDILKRVVRCRKKGQFKEDLEKTKRVIDLYLKEFEA